MELRNLRTFLQIVESESFTRAAELLGYTQSTVSTQIRQLEEELGCRLFDRINHRIELTVKGRQLLGYALRVDRDVLELTDSFRAEEAPKGVVRIVSSDSICEKMMLLNYSEFYHTYPGIRLAFSTANTNDMLEKLNRHEADVIFTLDTHVYQPSCVIAREQQVPLHFVAPADSPLAGRSGLELSELLRFPFLATESGMSYRKLLDDRLSERSLHLEPVLETGRTDILAGCVERGDGISLLPDFVTERAVRAGRMVRLDVKDMELHIWKQLIYHRDKWISTTLRAFLDFVLCHEFEW